MLKTLAESSVFVDARGLNCPMPLLKAKLALNNCLPGDVVKVFATDPSSVKDFHAFAGLSVHSLVGFTDCGDYFEFYLKKGDSERVKSS
jgi:TusA-related sulfurtransferase